MMNLCINQNEINELKHSHSSLRLTVPQMAKALNISRNTAYELRKKPGVPCLRVGKRVLVNRAMLQVWLDEQCSRTA